MQKSKQNNNNNNNNKNSKSISKKLKKTMTTLKWCKYSNKAESFQGRTWDPQLNKDTFFLLKRQVYQIGVSNLVVKSIKIIRNAEFEQVMILPSARTDRKRQCILTDK